MGGGERVKTDEKNVEENRGDLVVWSLISETATNDQVGEPYEELGGWV